MDRGSLLPGRAPWAGPGRLPPEAAVWGQEGGSAGGEWLGSGAVPLHSNPEGLGPPVHVSPGSLPARGLSLAAPTVSAPTPLTQARILESPGYVLLGRESPGITPSSRNSEQLQGGRKCRTPPRPARSGRG